MFHHNFTGHSILIQSKGNIWLRKLLIPWPAIFRTFLRFLRHWACPGQGNGNGSSIPWCQPTSIIQPAIGRRRVTARSGDTLEFHRFMITCTVIMTEKPLDNGFNHKLKHETKCMIVYHDQLAWNYCFNIFQVFSSAPQPSRWVSCSTSSNVTWIPWRKTLAPRVPTEGTPRRISCGDITSGMLGFMGM